MRGSGGEPIELTMSGGTWAMLFVLSILWAGTFALVKIAVVAVPPMTLVLLRVSLAAIAILPILLLTGGALPRGRAVWITFFGMGFLNNALPWTLFFWAQQSLPSGLGAILNAATPLFSVIVGHFLLADERMRANRAAGVVVGFVGVAVLIGPSLLVPGGADVLPELAFLAAALSYAFSGVVGRRMAKLGLSPLQATFGQLTAATILIAPAALLHDRPWTLAPPNAPQVAAILAIAILATAIPYILFFRIMARAGATNVMLVTLLTPPSAVLIGVFLMNEPLEPRNLLGLAFIALGLGLIDGRPLRVLRARLSGPDARRAEAD